MWRLVIAQWDTLSGVRKLTREAVISANEILDAIDEAAEDERREAESRPKSKRGR